MICTPVPTIIQLGGTAGLNHYMFGIGAYIQEHYELNSGSVLLRTISGSNYVAASMLSPYSVRSIWRLWSKRLDDLATRRPWTGLWYMIRMMQHHSRQVVSTIPSARQQMHHIRIGNLSRMSNEWECSHTDDDAYLSAIHAGAFIPLICGWFWRSHRGLWCVDGGLPLPYTPRRLCDLSNAERTINISVVDCRSLFKLQLLFSAVHGIWSRRAHHIYQYRHGYAHAKSVLRPRLDALLTRRPHRFILPEMTGELTWNISTNRFNSPDHAP